MASSRRSRPSSVSTGLVSTVAANLAATVGRGDRLAVGLSGGVDSVVLFDVLARLARRRHFRLSAIHVNHRISPHAGCWAAFCRRLCRARRVAFTTVEVAVPRGASLEAAARAARYAAFRALPVEFVVLAHNQDDQAETLLLQLLRGAGVKGLAAMPLVRSEGGRGKVQGGRRKAEGERKADASTAHAAGHPSILRPLLDVPRAEIVEYARARALRWIEDESNENTYFARNFLRHEVVPRIAERFPAYRATLGRSARHLADAAASSSSIAAADGAKAVSDGKLEVVALARVNESRARNLLRWFLAGHGVTMPGAERLAEAARQAVAARDDARVCVDLGAVELRRFAGALHVVRKVPVAPRAFPRTWRGEPHLALPELGGTLTMTKQRGVGLDPARLAGALVTVRVRQGGERLRLTAGGPRRSLKNLMQEAEIPPWERDRLPLLYCGDALVWVPGIGIDSGFRGVPGRVALRPVWNPAPPGSRAGTSGPAESLRRSSR
jgi:tRNA(Ile)-lysidine synthase